MNNLLIDAIQHRGVVELRYKGYVRTVEPHAYGVDAKGEEKLRCWQISGGSESGERHGWKLLNVSDAFAMGRTGASFAIARDGYKRGDTAMRTIFAQL